MLSRFECYELCVQSPRHVVAILRGIHGNSPVVLGEDFCGSAAVSRRWAAEAQKTGDAGRAVGVDLDPEALAFAQAAARAAGVESRVGLRRGDCIAGACDEPCDVLFVGNFSIGYCLTRRDLMRYLRGARARLLRGNGGFGGGVFVCDTYGGAGAYRVGAIERTHPGRGPEMIRYVWRHESADPLTGIVENSITFRVECAGDVVQELPRAFIYRWRLWPIAELREAMIEAGFASTAVHREVNLAPGATPAPVTDPGELGEDWVVLVAGRAS